MAEPMPTVSSLFIYPIKSCQGLSLTEMQFGARGPLLDRNWMVVDGAGRFITQRECPRLALVQPTLEGDRLTVHCQGFDSLPIPAGGEQRTEVRVWNFTGPAVDLGADVTAWFTRVLRTPARLVRFDEAVHRATSTRHTDLTSEVTFSDGYPALLVSLESLGDLNRRLTAPLPMNRFRPNIVVRDCPPFAEDTWSRIEAPDLELAVVKPCTRCAITTVNQQTGETGKEPLRTLATFRKTDDGVIFGQNCVHTGPGTLRIGDELHVE